VHKTDVGGVVLDVATPEQGRTEAAALLTRVRTRCPGARVEGVLVQRMARPGGVELLLGAVRDPQFGPVVMVGAGGIFVEILGDTATRLAPISRHEARRMFEGLTIAPVLAGARGRRAVDFDTIVDVIVRLGELMVAVPDLAEFEINPLVASPDGVMGIDVRGALA
jgi:acetyl-CoA synthetase (ADP-forming)